MATDETTAAEASGPALITDPYRAYSFKLDVPNVGQGHFTRCEGLGVRIQAIRYREGGGGPTVHHVPGRIEYTPVTLTWGVTASRELWDWIASTGEGQIDRRNVSLILLESDGVQPVFQYDLIDAWPAAWQSAPFDALSQEVAIESLTLVFDELKRS